MKKITGLEIIVISILFAITMQFVYTQTRRITRFPRSDKIDRLVYAGPVISFGASIACAVNELLEWYSQCRECTEDFLDPSKAACPDTCLEVNMTNNVPFEKNLKCSPEDDSKYTPWARAFTCSEVAMSSQADINTYLNCDYLNANVGGNITVGEIPGVQEKGCPNATPDPSSPAVCLPHPTNATTWYCTDNDILPTFRGCIPLGGAIPSYDSNFATSTRPEDFYIDPTTDILALGPECSVVSDGFGNITNTTSCYKYQPTVGIPVGTTEFGTYISDCQAYTENYEMRDKDINCCQLNMSCPRANPSGPPSRCCDNLTAGNQINNCAQSKLRSCSDNVCDRRSIDQADNWDDDIGIIRDLAGADFCCGRLGSGRNPAGDVTVCNANFLNPGLCAQFRQMATRCLNGQQFPGFDCTRGCWQDIDTTFFYEFVPKSNEALIIYWEVVANPSGIAAPGIADFFTRILMQHIEANGTVHDLPELSGLIHQKDFVNAFTVFAAAPIAAGSLIQGQTYRIRLQYFIPNIQIQGTALTMDVTGMNLRIVRVRE